ncbi:MAG: Rne/Rng family ribonuclease [Paracoccaceae bacterium]
MAKKMLIDATHAEETRVVVVDGNKVEEFDFESENKRQLAGNIYLAKVTRVEPSLQAAFVDYGGNRHGFLAFSEIHPDYYQIPVADREALMEEERAYADAMRARDEDAEKKKPRSKSRRKSSKAAKTTTDDAVVTSEIGGMETIDPSEDTSVEQSDAQPSPETGVDAPTADAPVEVASDQPSDQPVEETAAADSAPEDAEVVEEAQQTASETASDETSDSAAQDESPDEDEKEAGSTASDKDESIESVADEDDSDEIRMPRKPRPRRYKIQEVIKVRQVLLVQVVKEERGNKGAALTTYLSLAGRYCVLMPNTARGGGISRKITNAADRKKLKEIANEMEVPQGAGLIVRTAGAKRTKAEIKRDYEYLQRLWEQVRELTLKSIAPAKIYEEGDLIKRSIRDLYNRDIEEVLVEGERGYRNAKDFMKMIMPSHAKNVRRYEDSLPLFARFQVESYLGGMFNPTVQLKSGGYIVIGVTEALVAIDVNSGRATKEGSIEETALKTNLEAAEEVARQLRLRDLAGLIVIDFIDMEERKNNASVEKRMKDKLKTDRARIQVGRISGFGLMEMSRQRLRPGMIEATTQPCQVCHGTGLIRSDDNLALQILRGIEEEGTRRRSREVLVKCPVGIANYLMNQKRDHIAQIEARYGLSVRVEGDPSLMSPDFTMERFKTATRKVVAIDPPVVSVDASLMDQVDEDDDVVEEVSEEREVEEEEQKPKRRRRRRRSRRGKGPREDQAETEGNADGEADAKPENSDADAEANSNEDEAPNKVAEAESPAAETDVKPEAETPSDPATEATEATEEKPKKTARRTRKPKPKPAEVEVQPATDAPADAETSGEPEAAAEPAEKEAPAEKPKRKTATRKPRKPKVVAEVTEDAAPTATEAPKAKEAPKVAEPEPVVVAAAQAAPEVVKSAPAPKPTPKPEPEPDTVSDPSKPKRRGWWSLGR